MVTRDGRRRTARVAGIRTKWHTVDSGEFFCPGCGGDRAYRRRTGRRRFVLLGLPLLPRGAAAPVVECAACRGHFGTETLEGPTTTRLAGMLRDAVHSVALSVLAVGGTESRTAREAAVEMIRGSGFPDCSEEQLLALVAALRADPRGGGSLGGSPGDGADSDGVPGAAGLGLVELELREVLRPLAPHLAPVGRETLLLQGATIALADGPYQPAERGVLEAVGEALTFAPDEVARLLAAARTPS
ncbi:TerB family tellurite resistance protein [Streptomyces armeniacus]|uniref:TerB family tellurite resistance protein n=1 Tax=Streptomyces armeniacus TaxID=83291 RepID=A0A345XSF3_9ACTN|nr:TerB family tellurite resistance protein [Streptomyces armeniacus]AXK34569.1 TerB family tellurite resistance protein [Streptomyces armeniacus]